MDALVMCGGRGSRLEVPVEKPLLEIGGRPMVDRVLAALRESRVSSVTVAASPRTPETRAHLADRSVDLVETPGEGYVPDLALALEGIAGPVLTTAADLPLLDGPAVDGVLDAYDSSSDEGGSLAVYVPAETKRRLGLGVDRSVERRGRPVVPAGINVVSGAEDEASSVTDEPSTATDEIVHVTADGRFAVNVNRRSDAQIAEVLA